MTALVGADVESICTKCGDVWHVVVAKVGEKIVKVLCKQCNGQHRYKPPGGPVPVAKRAAGSSTSAASAAGGPAKPRRKSTDEPSSSVAADLSRPERPYQFAEAFTAGDRITHAIFGAGIVESSPGPGKIQVFFPSGRRILAVAKAVSALERPNGRGGTSQES